MNKHSIFILTILFLFGGLSNLKATDRFVVSGGSGNGSSWANAKGSISSALSDCSAGDVVYVAAGIYSERISIKDGVSVLGGFNAATGQRDIERYETIIDGSTINKTMIIKYDNDCTTPSKIEGFTVQNSQHTSEGGGAYLRGNVTLENCIIRNCKGSNGGGIYINGAGTVRNCIIELCESTSSGGAIRNKGGLIENTIIRGNQGQYGAIRNDGGIVRNCVVYNNSASVDGWPDSGGIYNPGGRVENCIITRNYGSKYAALHSDMPTINTVCWGNQQEEGFAEPMAYVADSSSLSSNNAADSGFTKAKSAMTLNKDNTHANGPNFKAPTNFVGAPTTAAEIAAMRAADWSYTAATPFIDKGKNTGVGYDIQGTTRPKGTAYDLGAYEYDPNAPVVAVMGVEVTLDTIVIEEEQKAWLSAIVSPAAATNKRLTWKSLDASIAMVEGEQVLGVAVGFANVVVTTVDGSFTDTCVIKVIEKPIVIIHDDVIAADLLNMDDYTVPSWTKMLVAKEAARADSSDVNLENLKVAIAALINKNMPYNVVATINGYPKSQMGFAWFTNAGIPAGKVQLIAKGNATESDFATPTLVVDATATDAKNLNYAVSQSGILKAAAMPVGTKRNYVSHKALATNLTANTTYSYRVGSEGYWSEIRSFTTAADSKEAFKFLYMTDSHLQDAEYVENARWAATTAVKHAPDAKFMIFTGDFVETGTKQNSEWEWEQWFDVSMKDLLAKVPLVPTDGNHDDSENLNYTFHLNTDNSFNKTAKVKPQFEGITYSFVYGDALFMMYSVQDHWRGSYNYTAGTCKYLSDDVANWFRAQVAAHPEVKWRIAAVHQNLFTGSGHQADKEAALYRTILLPVFQELRMDFVIQGHDHVYEVIGPVDNLTKTIVPNSISEVKSTPVDSNKNPRGQEGGVFDVSDGTNYFVNGTCGRKRYYPYTKEQMEEKESTHKVPNYWDLFTGKFGQPGAPAFSEITVTTDTITVNTYTANASAQATLFDSYRIIKTKESGLHPGTDTPLSMYPCPATDVVRLGTKVAKLQVYDTTGRLAHTVENVSTVNVSEWKQGVYMVCAVMPDGAIYKGRILKK